MRASQIARGLYGRCLADVHAARVLAVFAVVDAVALAGRVTLTEPSEMLQVSRYLPFKFAMSRQLVFKLKQRGGRRRGIALPRHAGPVHPDVLRNYRHHAREWLPSGWKDALSSVTCVRALPDDAAPRAWLLRVGLKLEPPRPPRQGG